MHRFGLADLIRVNQLVRGRIDFEGFRVWYDMLPPEQRRALTHLLCELAHQAGLGEGTWDEARAASGVPAQDSVLQQLWAVRIGEFPSVRLYEFIETLPDASLTTAFRMFVYLFGTAEGEVYRGESKACCNHWWHRDLLDGRVVRNLLTDPQFYMTSMKDDDRIKDTT